MTPCNTAPCDNGVLWPVEVAALPRIGLTLAAHAWYYVLLNASGYLMALAMAVLIYLKKSDDWMAFLTSVFLATFFLLFHRG